MTETHSSQTAITERRHSWPDWTGEAAAIIASGPSAKRANVAALRGKLRVIAIKETAIDLAPWADVAYGCDAAWWKHRRGLPKFEGLKIAWEKELLAHFSDIHLIQIKETRESKPKDRRYYNSILTDRIGVVGSGHNSGFQALNLAVQFGASRILLVGFDMNDRGGVHYYGKNNWFKGSNPDQEQFKRCIRCFYDAAPVLKEIGVDVVNASPSSELKCFRRMTIEQALVDWV